MKVLVVLLLAIASACAFSLKSEEKSLGLQSIIPLFEVEGRITNGKAAAIADFPYQAGLLAGGSWCGASLISTTWLVTAAHCVNGASVSSVTIYLGSATRQAGTSRAAREIIVHSGYNSNTLKNDIAVIRIDAVTYSTNIRAVTLPSLSDTSSYAGSAVVASGWGKTSETSGVASTLQYADLTVVTNSVCSSTYGTSVVTAGTICTSTTNRIGTCNGDSGGPLVLKSDKKLVGITSFVASAGCEQGYPAGFTRVTEFRSWIQTQTGV